MSNNQRIRELTRLRVKKFRETQHAPMPSISFSHQQLQDLSQSGNVEQLHGINIYEPVDNSSVSSNSNDDENIDLINQESERNGEESKSTEELTDKELNEDKLVESHDSDDNDDVDISTDEENVDQYFDTVGAIRRWALLYPPIPHTRLELLLDILRRDYPNLPKSAKTFLSTTHKKYTIEVFDENSDNEFIYFGIYDSLSKCINPDLHEVNSIKLLVNVDGLPLFKSSSKQLWPILCKIFHEPDVYKPFPVALYCGNKKPSNVEKYLEKFIKDINTLQRTGINVNGRLFEVSIKAFICDRPARAFLKCIIGHGGYWACERCTVQGKRKYGRTIYPLANNELRTDASFRAQTNAGHHIGISPLLRINPHIDLIRQFPLDAMHSVHLGVMKKLFEYWLSSNLNTVRLSTNAKTQLSRLLFQLRRQIPLEFQRTTRSLSEINKYKATEFQFILLYAGPVIFKKILPKSMYKHFLLLHVGCRLLSSKHLAVQKCNHARFLLTKFVEIAPTLYGEQCLIGNMHGLIHLADDTEYMNCPISNITAYAFENTLGRIKKCLRHGNRPLAQLCRRLNESSVDIEQPITQSVIKILRQLHRDDFDNTPVTRVQFKNTSLSNKSPNNTVLLNNNKILEIHSMFIPANDNINSMKITGFILKKIEPLYVQPCNAASMKMWRVSRKYHDTVTYMLSNIHQKMIRFNISREIEEKMYVMPLLHT